MRMQHNGKEILEARKALFAKKISIVYEDESEAWVGEDDPLYEQLERLAEETSE